MPHIPSESDINVHDSLDERSALESLLGNSVDQAKPRFLENVLPYQEDLFAIGRRGATSTSWRRFPYLLSPNADGDSLAIDALYRGVESRRNNERSALQADVDNGRNTASSVPGFHSGDRV